MQSFINEHNHIKGWGIDSDRKNEPTYPMKKYTGDDHQRSNYERPTLQESNIEILQSNERPSLSAVYGTSTPPSGLSGIIRRYAFRYSEGSWGHWLPLLIADRVNVVEGLIDDLKQGYFPNIFKERGWNAEWKYNRKSVIQKITIGAAVTSAVVAILIIRNKNKRKRIAYQHR
jgi:hypothetical protein